MSTLMEDLKETTRPMHDSAEGGPFQGLLAHGKLTEKAYVEYLGQLYLLHRTLEGELAKHKQTGCSFADIVDDKQFQEPFLKRDLEKFGVQPESLKPGKATTALLEELLNVSRQSPEGLLGFHYVLLGSKHGGKMVAKNTRERYGLTDAGALYFDPYGSDFMPLWMQFKNKMNELNWSETERKAICDGAIAMFKRIGQMGDELMPLVRV